MARRKFSTCLNLEPKLYNFSIGAIIGGGVMLSLFGVGKGLMWGLGAGAIGFGVGGYLSKQWFLGQMQRKLYWNMPWADKVVDKNTPPSDLRQLM